MHYPVAIDNNYGTWNAYDNEYWPADYLIDAQGNVRHVTSARAATPTTEKLIRQLLAAAHPGRCCRPRRRAQQDADQRDEPGDLRRLRAAAVPGPEGQRRPRTTARRLPVPASLPLGGLGLSGTWTDHAQEATAGMTPSWSSASRPRTSTWCWAATGRQRLDQRQTTPRPRRQRGPRAVHPLPGRLLSRQAGAARFAGGPGLRLHVRLIARSSPPPWLQVAGRLAGDDVHPVVSVDQGDEAHQRGELLVVVVLGRVRPQLVSDAGGWHRQGGCPAR